MGRFTRISNGVLRSFAESSDTTIYDQTFVVGVGGITSGTAITLPASGNYTGAELVVTLNGQDVEVVTDYNYVGSGTRTQISFTFDLFEAERVRFRKERNE